MIVRSVIAWGAPNKHNTHEAHGAPLGEEEVRLTKAAYGWPPDAQFLVPEEVRRHFRENLGARGQSAARGVGGEIRRATGSSIPAEAGQLDMIFRGELPNGLGRRHRRPSPPTPRAWPAGPRPARCSTRSAKRVPWLLGGSADLAPSTLTLLKFDGAGDFLAGSYAGRNFHFGIREHAMGAICNGMALCGLRPYGATFFVFTDYMRPPMRLAALMGLPVLYIFTHDSIGVGEDGPTHQPVEHLAALRAIPNLVVLRPGDANEVAEAYRAVMRLRPTSRRRWCSRGRTSPPWTAPSTPPPSGTQQGGYVLADAPGGKPAGHPHRHRQRGVAVRGRPRAACRPRASRPAWSACPVGNSSTPSRPNIARRCCRRR